MRERSGYICAEKFPHFRLLRKFFKHMKNQIHLLFLFIIAMGWSFLSCNSSSASAQTSETSEVASTSSSTNTDIEIFGDFNKLEPIFHQESDTTYVINFWATWCKPCVEELPYFERLHEKFVGEKIKVILVSLDFPKDYEAKLIPFVKENQLKSEVVLLTDGDYNAWIDKVSPEWGGAIPVTVIYNAQERKFIGEQFANYEELDALVRAML